jgi:predicted  nucleic acid-binding Zn-ribbon protein
MATERTPTHKRIKRAEEGRDDWKMKAVERREENAKLKLDIRSYERILQDLSVQNEVKEQKLVVAERKITELEREIEDLKKKC